MDILIGAGICILVLALIKLADTDLGLWIIGIPILIFFFKILGGWVIYLTGIGL